MMAEKRRRIAPRSVRWLLGSACAILVAFHAELLLDRVRDGSLADPYVAGRWLGTAALLALALRFRLHSGLFSGRRALVFWLLAALLHAVPGAPLAPVVGEALQAAAWAPAAALLALAVLTARALDSVRPGPCHRLARAEVLAPRLRDRRPDGARAPPA